MSDREADVVVVGSGMAGLVSTVRALEQGGDVVLLEKGYRLGGTLPITGGTLAVSKEAEPVVDAYEPIEEGIEWLEELGVSLREPTERWLTDDVERIKVFDPPDLVEFMGQLIAEEGGEILLDTPMERLKTDELDEVAGVIAHNATSGRIEIDAPSVILATGGICGNEELLERYLPNTDIWLNRHPWSTGDGFLAALDVGAKTTRGLSNVVGHSKPAPPARISFDELRCSQVYETAAIAIDSSGRRFTDESKDKSGSRYFTNEFIRRVEGTGYLVVDQRLADSRTGRLVNSPKVADLIERAKGVGGPVLEADSLAELGRKLDEVGVNGRRAVETIEEFNEAMRTGNDADLDPPRSNDRDALDEPPFRAVGVLPSVTFIRGGLDVNHNAQVVKRARSISSVRLHQKNMDYVMIEPIDGLYATGIEVGRSENHSYYHLGLSLSLSTGRIAGKHAAGHAKRLRA